MADGKRHGRCRLRVRRALVRVFYLFYFRLVQLPHHLVRGAPSSKWWAGYNGAGRSGRGFPSAPALFCFWCSLTSSGRLCFRWYPPPFASSAERRGCRLLRRTFYRCRNILSISPIKISRSLGISSLSTSSSSPSSTLPTSGPGATPADMTSRPSTARSFNVRHCR